MLHEAILRALDTTTLGQFIQVLDEQAKELERIAKAATYAASLGLKVNAGHGLTYHNVKAVAALPEMHELNIGHAIIGRAVMTGLKEAVAEMKRLMLEARG